MSKTKTLFIAAVAGVLVLGLIGISLARKAEREAEERARVRLVLLWPNLMQMPEYDRSFVTSLASSCKLDARSAIKSDVVACLKGAAGDKGGVFPAGLDASSAPGKLDQLLNLAK